MSEPSKWRSQHSAGRLAQLGDWLNEHRLLWTSRPFVELPTPWEKQYPDLAQALRAMDQDSLDRYEDRPQELALSLPEPFPTLTAQSQDFARWPVLAQACQPDDLAKQIQQRPRGIKGRKWQQIVYFSSAVQALGPGGWQTWLEWCSGKGHLGRQLTGVDNTPVKSTERDRSLCEAGRAMARTAGLAQTFYAVDVLKDPLSDLFGPNTAAAALHACGKLHTTMLREAVRAGCPLIALAPCCYQRYEDPEPKPLSARARHHDLRLTGQNLRLVAFEDVVSSPRARRARRQEQAYRLALDLYLRQQSGHDNYQAQGPLKPHRLSDSFTQFAARWASKNGHTLPQDFQASSWESAGWERQRLVRALGLVRGLFRRPMESWLIMDRLLFLEESGYEAWAGVFCPRDITPRNLLILARKKS